jgi:hypothetical protein
MLGDALVLCTTEAFNPGLLSETFGNFCVEITEPLHFFELITNRLTREMILKESIIGRVIYQEREYCDLEPPPGPLGFVKPPDRYQHQQEFRFLWTIDNPNNLQPFLLDVPEVKSLCRRHN